jgi:hypothetical protein
LRYFSFFKLPESKNKQEFGENQLKKQILKIKQLVASRVDEMSEIPLDEKLELSIRGRRQ